MEKKVTFLFGSGADTDACKKLKSGATFAADIISNKYNSIIESLLGEKLGNFKLIYPSSKKIYIETILSNEEKSIELFGEELVDKIKKYSNRSSSEKYENEKKDINKKCSQWYKLLTQGAKQCTNDLKIKKFFLENAVLFSSLDEKFNSLRNFELDANAKRVINTYYTVYISMFEKLYDLENFDWNFESIFNTLREDRVLNISHSCYYKTIRNLNCNVVTTNYTSLAEVLSNKKTVYLHGKLNWFEDIKGLSVYDCKDKKQREILLKLTEKNKNSIIPFIFIPSGIKPIICKKQIVEFYDFVTYLEKSNLLCTIGYKFNSEDNHINSIIIDWLNADSNNKLVFFNFNNEVDLKKYSWINYDVYDLRDISIHSFENMLNSNHRIINIPIDEDNSRIAFSTFTELIKDPNRIF